MSYGNENHISKQRAKVKVVMANGDRIEGFLYIRQGQRIQEILNDDRVFLPLVLEDGSTKLFHKQALHEIEDLEDVGGGQEESWGTKNGSTQSFADGDMNVDQALDILGLNSDYTREEVIDQHRKLIAKNHPDVGGSTFIAGRINDAKVTLIKALG